MPSILFHELVGYEIAKKYPKYNTNSFYLGLVVPDAVNAYGFASKEKRWAAHFRDENLDKWEENVIEFYNKNYGKYDENYLKGYTIHILTDILCDKIYQEKIYPDLIQKGFNYNSAYSYYEKSIKKLENNNVNEQWWKYVKENIINAEKKPINNLTTEMIGDWIRYIIDSYENRAYEETEYITMDFVYEVIEKMDFLN